MSNWVIYNKCKNIKEISEKFKITPLTSVILCNRNISDENEIEKILSNDISDINDAKLLPDVDKACEVLYESIKTKKSIRIVGDYDIDGVSSTYILVDAIKRLGGMVSYAIPDRVNDGYGINTSIIDKAIIDKIDVIVTCDNGIAASEQITYAKKNGIICIVTDHHDIGELPKDASAIINPKRKDVIIPYPFPEICGAVVAWKFMTRFYELYGKEFDNKYDEKFVINNYIEFAMIATIGDIMPLVNENHIIAKIGLKQILKTKNEGLKKLLDVAGVDFFNKGINAYHIGYIIGPLINAAGRMETASVALDLFLSNDEYEINKIADNLKKLNDERKSFTEKGVILAIEKIEKEYINDKIFVVYVENLGEQVAGIVAGRIKEKYNKPTIILTDTKEKDEAKASCRSIDAYDIYEGLTKHKDMFIKFGGHKLAAGFSILKKDVDKLRYLLNAETNLTEKDFIKKVYIDVEFPLTEINENIIKDIEKLEPYGQAFNRPTFATKDVKVFIDKICGNEKNVVKLFLEKDGKSGKGVIFVDSEIFEKMLKNSQNLDILYYPKINEYKGFKNIEIQVLEYR